ncbi:TPA: hypothetical protein MEC17_000244 [Klebsiella pneumoniae]|uniref:hypothetical protein n=1 Tax=Klebsiella pneumoniae TaxID=573 RepID=UPI000C7996AD|nr:hypothetical protein [Klebsiella pneumoniae]EIX9107022.1 hypothetical protein [Klebsiella pneumoniae]EIY1877469.1 hypothetical protein [Klebsiella pneumoniae]EKJ7635785.1 hypothetical protein [Klebsiella pneumoniae]MCQ0531496.1 hypothetical protein [Klebsiella pneumoniae]MCQ0574305.1 hypothetical protein [Klebsiella pneumoniae]
MDNNMSIAELDIRTYGIKDISKEQMKMLIEKKISFRLSGIRDMSGTVKKVEKMIEDQELKCRVYTEYRAAGMAAAVWGPAIAIGAITAAGIALHNVVTWGPDYELGKNYVSDTLSVIYQH